MRIICFLLLFILLYQPLTAQVSTDTLKIGYTIAPPFIVEENGNLTGINIWLWKRVAKDLNLSYELVPMGFTQMLDSLYTGGIDLSINPLTITGTRSKRMEFTHSYYAANSTIVIAEASSYDKIIRFLKAFFSMNFLKGLMILMMIIFLFGLAGWYFERRKNPEDFRKGPEGIWDGIWWSAVTLTTVGYGDKSPRTRMGKLAALALMFGGLLFISGLTASIASSLTVYKLNSDPASFDEFKVRKVGSVKETGTIQYLRSRFFNNITEYDGVAAGLNAVKDGEIHAFMYDEPLLKYRIREDNSLQDLNLLPVKFDLQFYAFGLPKERFVLEQIISQRILEIIETEEWQIVLNEFGLSQI